MHTLYQLNVSYIQHEHILSKLTEIIHINDSLILLGESLLLAHHPILQKLSETHRIYMLNDDRDFLFNDIPDFIQCIDDIQWVDLIYNHHRCICFQ